MKQAEIKELSDKELKERLEVAEKAYLQTNEIARCSLRTRYPNAML